MYKSGAHENCLPILASNNQPRSMRGLVRMFVGLLHRSPRMSRPVFGWCCFLRRSYFWYAIGVFCRTVFCQGVHQHILDTLHIWPFLHWKISSTPDWPVLCRDGNRYVLSYLGWGSDTIPWNNCASGLDLHWDLLRCWKMKALEQVNAQGP